MGRAASLRQKAFAGLARLLVSLGVLLFFSAWQLTYWQGWVFLAVFGAAVTFITIYFLEKDPALIERRLKAGPSAEKQKSQKIIQSLASLFVCAMIIFPGIDHRFGWSDLVPYVVALGNALVALGMLVIFFVFKENSHASATIEVTAEQKVVSTGPYRLVRHPMYAGALLLILGIPLALGSAWGLLFCIPLIAVIVWRLIKEEEYLAEHLPGYVQYLTKTRYRLIPGIY